MHRRTADLARRRIAPPIVALLLLAGVDPARAADNAAIADLYIKGLDVEVTAIVNPAFDGVFGATIYDVTETRFSDSERFSPDSVYRVYRSGDRLVPIFDPGTDTELAYFDGLLDEDFRLTRATAADFRAALMGLMPDDFFEDVEGEPIQQGEGEWVFLCGTFFDDLKGFVVSVDDTGGITGVRYSLGL